jgi:beta-phosphoglucomutase-like phosphatase (HAD superfamily)
MISGGAISRIFWFDRSPTEDAATGKGIMTSPDRDAGQRAVVLDLDGILLDGMGYHIQAWHAAFAPYGLKIDSYRLYLLEGIKTHDVIDIICELYNVDLPTKDREIVALTKKKVYSQTFSPTPLDGAKELLDTLVGFQYKIAIATGTLESSALATLSQMEMLDQIDVIISADLNIPGKPDPAPFSTAVAKLGTPTSHTLGVDNAPAGITSATLAGLPCVGVATYLPEKDLREAQIVFSDIHQFTAWLVSEHLQASRQGAWKLRG